MSTHEKRITTGTVEARGESERKTLVGYAAVFNQEAVIAGMFREVILPGAFAEAVKADDVRAQFNHESNFILGRTGAGTLRLSEDEHGLRYEIDMPDTSYARDLMVSVQRGDVTQSSFMFDVPTSTDETWDYSASKGGMLPLRQIKRVKLYDVAPVVFPAYEGTSVSARALRMKDMGPCAECDMDSCACTKDASETCPADCPTCDASCACKKARAAGVNAEAMALLLELDSE